MVSLREQGKSFRLGHCKSKNETHRRDAENAEKSTEERGGKG